jgi:2-hydroxy-6-oxonona-2,4-dienedioate hydrolase
VIDDGKAAFAEAERRMFAHYGLDVETRFLHLRDPSIQTRVIEYGSGPPILFVHGGGASASAWAPLLAELSGFRLLAVDRPGCGYSDPFDYGDTDLRAHGTAFMESLLDELELDQVPIVANSMGGLWTFWLALARPERVSAIAQLGCPALLLDTSAPRSMRLLAVRGMLHLPSSAPANPQLIVEEVVGAPAFAKLPPELIECMARAEGLWARGPTRLSLIERALHLRGSRLEVRFGEEDLISLSQPVLFLWGDRDSYGSPEAGERACRLIPKGSIEVLSAGHLPWLDEPSRCAQSLAAFIRAAVPA